MKSYLIGLVLITVLAGALMPGIALAQQGTGISLVPCGRSDQGPNAKCTFNDLIILIVRIINYLLSASVIVAMYYILLSAFNLASAMGNAEKIASNREGLTRALIGFAIVLLSMVFINLLVNGIFGINCSWWTNPSSLASGGCLVN